MGERVLIAGCGFVGERLARRLVARGCEVFALRRSEVELPAGVEPVHADLARIESLFPKEAAHGHRYPERIMAFTNG